MLEMDLTSKFTNNACMKFVHCHCYSTGWICIWSGLKVIINPKLVPEDLIEIPLAEARLNQSLLWIPAHSSARQGWL